MSNPERSARSGITRRAFVAGTAAAGALAATGWKADFRVTRGGPDLAVAHGADPYKNTRAVVEAVGGMGAFVASGQVVNILPNAQGANPGTSTNPQVVKAVVEMCKEAGAKAVRWLSWLPERSWERSNIKNLVQESGAELVLVDVDDESLWKTVDVPGGFVLKQIRIFNALWDSDVFITMPIIKDHAGSRFTGVLKNYMGTSHPSDNRPFHPNFTDEEHIAHMENCIADLAKAARVPDLCVADAMTILTTKGPFGPGDIANPNKVIAGADRVAVDSYGATLLGLEGSKVTMIQKAFEHGLGEIDLTKLAIKEIELG